ncbi:MAG TPA: tetraacyldisaccharide 4'-kinase [Candidatus Dormibacteraeota bacterium]|nr:tetraacyldisaccharide 4'-kinase [Candidatus Dormibacteraeota bacterium]
MTLANSFLWPLSILYGAGARLRAWTYRAGIVHQRRLRGVVISVGNLTVGGVGKTPMVVWLAQRLMASGKSTAILSRSYRPLPQRSRVADGMEIPPGWNDEAALIHNRLGNKVEIGVGANRFAKGRELESRGVECFILDDGFQHLQLARDLDIVLLDATNPFGGGYLLPAGRLREPISALRRAHIIVITRSEHAPATEAIIQRHTSAPIFYARTELLGMETYGQPSSEKDNQPTGNQKFYAFCGIGNPSAFFDDLAKWGIELAGHATFRDHHLYTEADLSELESRALAAGANVLLCTEKDIQDLRHLRTNRLPILFCKIALHFNDEEGLWQTILGTIARKKPVSSS